ncbi:hypothetical protein D3C76_932720 [compost metagenome]
MEGDLQAMAANLVSHPQSRQELADRIVALTIRYVQMQLNENRAHLLAEQALLQEALLNPRLTRLAQNHRRILSRGVVHFFEVLGSERPIEDARLLTAIILQMEYQGLLDGVENLNVDAMRGALTRYLYLVMGL